MKIFEPIYSQVLKWAKHPFAERYLAGISFAESSFFPIPVDVMLAPMVLAKPNRAWRLAAITTVMSVLGGLFGYFIGVFFFDSFGVQLIEALNAHDAFESSKAAFLKYGMIIVLVAGFTPVPYKIFTIASGVMGIAVIPFLLMSLISRGARFFLVAGLIKVGGEKLEATIHKQIELLGWLCLVLVVAAVVAYSVF